MSQPAYRLPFLRAALVLALAAPVAVQAEVPDFSRAEFKLFRDYQAALKDERVQKIPEANRLAAIAKNFKVTQKALAEAVEKGEKYPEIGKTLESEVRSQIDAGELAGKVHEIKVDDSDAHVVTFLAWKNDNPDKLEQEAALAAIAAARGAPITSTIAVWAVDAATGRKVFEAKISADAAGRFNPDRVAMFAATRYIRIFENVRNAYKGTPPTEPSPTGEAAADAAEAN